MMRLVRWLTFAALASLARGLAWLPFHVTAGLTAFAAECERRKFPPV